MNALQRFIVKLLKIRPAVDNKITITEPLTFQANVLKNQIWYRGDPVELEQFYKQIARSDVEKARFWAAVPSKPIRKTHSGIVQIVIDRLADIVVADMDEIDFGEPNDRNTDIKNSPIKDLWDEIANDNDFDNLVNEAITGALYSGDGAFKISIDKNMEYPIIEFFDAGHVDFVRNRGRITEILYYTDYKVGEKEYRLKETYGKGYIKYNLYSDDGKEVPLNTVEEVKDLKDATYTADFIMGEPLIFFKSGKWKGRGKALFDSKTDNLDSLDEIISQWLDAIRDGRALKCIPEDLLPRDPETGAVMPLNSFESKFTVLQSNMAENANNVPQVIQPTINYESYVNSYSNFLDLCLQGIISPATLGIDLKKNDAADSQREKEKITIHTRNKITDTLSVVLPKLAVKVMQVKDLMTSETYGDYEASIKFGEYGAPGFEQVCETVGNAKAMGIMSTEQAIEEMYGDAWTEEEKALEVQRIKDESSVGIEPVSSEGDLEDEEVIPDAEE